MGRFGSFKGEYITISKKFLGILLVILLLIGGGTYYFLTNQQKTKEASLAYDFANIKVISQNDKKEWSMINVSDYFMTQVPSQDNVKIEKQLIKDFSKILSKNAIDDYQQFSERKFVIEYLETHASDWQENAKYKTIKEKFTSETTAKKEFAKSIWFEKNRGAILDDYKRLADEQNPESAKTKEE